MLINRIKKHKKRYKGYNIEEVIGDLPKLQDVNSLEYK